MSELTEGQCPKQEENIIVLLQTGAAKMMIAVELIKHHLLLQRPPGQVNEGHEGPEGAPHIVFLSPQGQLAHQQAEAIADSGVAAGRSLQILTVDTRDHKGSTVDLWSECFWQQILSCPVILVGTPELVCQALSKGLLRMKDVALLVADECHHCCAAGKQSDSPYALIFREHYRAAPQGSRPRVLGFTVCAFLGKASSRLEFTESVEALKAVMDCAVVTVRDTLDIDTPVPNKTQELLCYDEWEPSGSGSALEKIEGAIRRSSAACRLSELRAAACHLPDPSMRPVQGVARPAAEDEEGWRCPAVQEAAQQTKALLKDLGPLGGLMALGAALQLLVIRMSRRDSEAHKVGEAERLAETDLKLQSQELLNEFPLEELLDDSGCAAKCLVELAEGVFSVLMHLLRDVAMRRGGGSREEVGEQGASSTAWNDVESSILKARNGSCAEEVIAHLLSACRTAMAVLGSEEAVGAALRDEAVNRGSAEHTRSFGGGAEGIVSDKVVQLAKVILECQRRDPGQQRFLVLVETNATAAALAAVLKRSPKCLTSTSRCSALRWDKVQEEKHGRGGGNQVVGQGGRWLSTRVEGRKTRATMERERERDSQDRIYQRVDGKEAEKGKTEELRLKGSTSTANMRMDTRPPKNLLIPSNSAPHQGTFRGFSRCRSPGHCHLSPRHLVGGSCPSEPLLPLLTGPYDLAGALADFFEGDCRLLVATEIAEEGLDAQARHTVLSFDPPRLRASFVQRRGRARALGGRMVVLVSRQDAALQEMIRQFGEDEAVMNEMAGEAAPAAAEEGWGGSDDDDKEAQCRDENHMVVESTGASITASGAVSLLEHYCQVSCGTADGFRVSELPLYYWRERNSEPFQVFLGPWCPVSRAVGLVISPVRAAKASAALEAVRALHATGAIDDHLNPAKMPFSASRVPADPDKMLTDAQWIDRKLAVASVRREVAGVSGRHDRGASSIDVHVVAVPELLKAPAAGGEADRQEVSLVRHRLRAVPSRELRVLMKDSGNDMGLQVFASMLDSLPCTDLLLPAALPPEARSLLLGLRRRFGFEVVLEPLGEEEIGRTELAAAQAYHRRVLGDSPASPSKDPLGPPTPLSSWSCDGRLASYIIAPSKAAAPREGALSSCWGDERGGWRPGAGVEMVETTYLGSHGLPLRYIFDRARRPATDAATELPMTSASSMSKKGGRTFAEYYKAKYGLEVQSHGEALVEALRPSTTPWPLCLEPPPKEQLSLARTAQEYPELDELPGDRGLLFLVPEFFRRVEDSDRALAAWHASHTMPFILWSLEQLLVACDLRSFLAGLSPKEADALPAPGDLLTAITTEAAGRSFNNERLEFLGDSFLKWEISCQLFETNPLWGEGEMSELRSRLVSNRTLALRLVSRGLARYLRLEPFRDGRQLVWRAPGMGEAGVEPHPASEEVGERVGSEALGLRRLPLKLKALSDAAEALLGSHLLHGGTAAARRMLSLLGISALPGPEGATENFDTDDGGNDNLVVECLLSDLLKPLYEECESAWTPPPEPSFITRSLRLGPTDDAQRRRVSEAIGFEIRDASLVREALTHCSRPLEPSYQRLEFLGDAVLDFVVTRALFDQLEGFTPGLLTVGRQVAVCNDTLSRRCVELGLHGAIRHLSVHLANAIAETAKLAGSLPGQLENTATSAARPPRAKALCKCCADVLESLIGAVFVEASSDGRNLANVDVLSNTAAMTPERDLTRRDEGLKAVGRVVLGKVNPIEDCGALAYVRHCFSNEAASDK